MAMRIAPLFRLRYCNQSCGMKRNKLSRYTIFCAAAIILCVLMYIRYGQFWHVPTYGEVDGWTFHTNRDTKVYVQPKIVTLLRGPKQLCPPGSKRKLNLLIIVFSAVDHFEQRHAVRESYGSHEFNVYLAKLYATLKEKYRNYNFIYDFYPQPTNSEVDVSKTNISLKSEDLKPNDSFINEVETENNRFDENIITEYIMNHQLNYSIPIDFELDYKIVFLLGVPSNNTPAIENAIREENNKYDDVIQENFIDTYNNLTLKSIMMLKYVTNNCNNTGGKFKSAKEVAKGRDVKVHSSSFYYWPVTVRYIMKTDDDTFVNLPNLASWLRNKSREFDAQIATGHKDKEYLLRGTTHRKSEPFRNNPKFKWFVPYYMFADEVFPDYLSGGGYLFSADAAAALYRAALETPYVHMEDVFITGICAKRAVPPLRPLSFYHEGIAPVLSKDNVCNAHAFIFQHKMSAVKMRDLTRTLRDMKQLGICERIRLIKQARIFLEPKYTL